MHISYWVVLSWLNRVNMTNLVHKAIKKVKVIQKRLKTTQSGQKSCIDVRRMPLEFEVDDKAYLNVLPMKGGYTI